MATKVARAGVERESGWLYYLDKKGHVSRVRMARGGGKVKKTKPQVVAKVGVEREEGFLYFIDRDGDVSRAKMARAGRRRKKATARRPTFQLRDPRSLLRQLPVPLRQLGLRHHHLGHGWIRRCNV